MGLSVVDGIWCMRVGGERLRIGGKGFVERFLVVSVAYRILAFHNVTMIKKTENCLYCGDKMDSKRATKKFCSELHRLYFWRENNEKTYPKTDEDIKQDGVEKENNKYPNDTPDFKNDIQKQIWEAKQNILNIKK